MLKLSLKEGQYVNIGDELNIARSNNEPDPAKRKDTYYPEPEFSSEAKKQIKQIIWNEKERQKKTQSN